MQNGLSQSGSSPTQAHHSRFPVLALALLAVALFASPPTLGCEEASTAPVPDIRAFLTSLTGEWVGACKQATDGQNAEDKYFHAVVKQVDGDNFDTQFEYYRTENGEPVLIGTSSITTTVTADGAASNRIKGKGVVRVNMKPKNQTHDLTEALKATGPTTLEGRGSGTITVSGMPLNLGKNGKITDSESTWKLDKDVLTIRQSIKAGFRVVFFSKTFRVTADYVARRGSDLAALMRAESQSASSSLGTLAPEM